MRGFPNKRWQWMSPRWSKSGGWVLLILSLWALGCKSTVTDERVTGDGLIPVTIETSMGPVTFSAELADTPNERARGLMFRESLAPREAMLFVFPREGPRSFWMKNVPISLDIIFITEDQLILGVVHRAEPQSVRSQMVNGESKYVLEVTGGTAERLMITKGQKVRFIVGETER
ncbi:MAG: DUF192 domain-containing protein [Myxococcales bacterium]|nr:DUF192 domain-containing protein [Myxococcales bacterium]